MKLHGKDALAFHKELEKRDAELSAERLAKARAEAAAKGKESFDLDELEKLCDTSSEGRLGPVERRRETFEYMYYVRHPEIMTIAELAQLIEEINKW